MEMWKELCIEISSTVEKCVMTEKYMTEFSQAENVTLCAERKKKVWKPREFFIFNLTCLPKCIR